MERRTFMGALAGGLLAAPLAARAQPPAMPLIGYLSSSSPDFSAALVAGFHRGLGEAGFVEGRNVTVEYRWALGQYDRLPALAAELARRKPAVLVAVGGEPSALAAKAATSTIPIVFSVGGNPIRLGLVASYNRPGGNATGISILTTSLEAKRLELLHEVVPRAPTIGYLLHESPVATTQRRDVEEAARALGLQIQVLRANTDREIDAAFKTLAERRIGALLVAASPFLDTRQAMLVTLAARRAVPTMYQFREHALAGGLVSYGADLPEAHRQVGDYAGRILKGAKPADLPVLQPTKFELVINLKAAKALGLTIPPSLLARADEVIQ
jgi:putative ABC transport system substrate-binding protein